VLIFKVSKNYQKKNQKLQKMIANELRQYHIKKISIITNSQIVLTKQRNVGIQWYHTWKSRQCCTLPRLEANLNINQLCYVLALQTSNIL